MVQGGYRIAAGAEAGANMASSAALRELQRELETKANDLSKLQKDIAKNHQVRKKYTIQLGENELVLKELDLLNEDANVYKLIGPVLVKQDLAEANANVRKRIDYISAELKRLDATLQDLDEKQNSKKDMVCIYIFLRLSFIYAFTMFAMFRLVFNFDE
ncbi:prefoldin subunit 6 isoform X1 [Malania oleifera]|uniref:prefoldin subunit 6 isoform X1 n=1 Tax=Malania oleifera TaxID=397392 RepID=UPI0025AE9625|nr:prefoldin subunit 6 isoform X1 [Malania oleifera]